ncbi:MULTISPECIES: PRC-barrel domain-containing protein [Mesorhizobium]|uniref:Sporulation protein YlmC with PRC-barrel domain n=1 Tax=Mesorhizobium shonense TaxID=1209948 RepID=A0ABV2I083_9HYPH|nr:PRC-barrel domain containing protein [Mesorhizobium sp. M1B.F.Ca.ET.045.04.1.1]RWA69363.1 MAG: PRC-barrel domain containing protein [Mesorhizobium sp.]RWD99072.1 MAG: PRC-barrel domain containing protein [Mesorhizobium sp.]TIS45394.1 MAG: PRC-barrel domain containing protein [Mesorhizobium sp.]
MIPKILVTAATAALLSTALCTAGAYAEDKTKPASQAAVVAPVTDGSLVSKIMGATVYDSTADDATKIGKVNDIVLDKGGKAKLIVIGVGGVLGVGEKNVAYDFNKIEWVDKKGERWLVAKTTKEELQAQPNFDIKAYETASASNNTQPAASTANQTAPAKTDQTATASIDKSTLTAMPSDKISAANLIGTNVYGADDAKVGEIGDVILTGDKKVDAIIVDVGGFLGIGEKKVAVGMENLKFMTDKNGNRYLYTNFTKDQLEAQTAYDKGTYAQNRDKQRIIVKQ